MANNATSASETRPISSLSVALALTVLVVLAAILRTLGTRNDLWLDEIISLRIADHAKSLWDIFSTIHSDNNHYLNTMYLYLMRSERYAPALRYASVAFGVGLVPAGYWLLERRSKRAALILATFFAFSYPLIHFSSEARGYSGSLLGSVLAYSALTRCLASEEESRRSLWGLLYGLSLVLALLSQLTVCLIWFSIAAGSLFVFMREPDRRTSLRFWVGLNLLPAGAFAALYFFDLSRIAVLGGPSSTLSQGMLGLGQWAVEWPTTNAWVGWFVLASLLGVIGWQLFLLWKSSDPNWVLFGLIYVLPPIMIQVAHPIFFTPRYFLVILPFVFVPLAMALAQVADSRFGRVVVILVLLLFVTRQCQLYGQFLRVGRGNYSAGLEYMISHSPSQSLMIESNQDFRSLVELGYFAPEVLGDRRLLYINHDNQSFAEADWYIYHGDGGAPAGPPKLDLKKQRTWYRAAFFPTSELSGQSWTIYSHSPKP